jgi:hypothetical protein
LAGVITDPLSWGTGADDCEELSSHTAQSLEMARLQGFGYGTKG